MTIKQLAWVLFRRRLEAELVELCLANPQLLEEIEEAIQWRGHKRDFRLCLTALDALNDYALEDDLQKWLLHSGGAETAACKCAAPRDGAQGS